MVQCELRDRSRQLCTSEQAQDVLASSIRNQYDPAASSFEAAISLSADNKFRQRGGLDWQLGGTKGQ